ncbi:hypothetical protein ABPG74_000922 [Tetrahymena malaccensis]
MNQNFFVTNDKSDSFDLSQNSSWNQNQLQEVNCYISSQIQLISYMSDETNLIDDNQYNNDTQNYNCNNQVVYEPEYFLNICSQIKDESNISIDEKKYSELDSQQQKFQESFFNMANNISKPQSYHQEVYQNKNSQQEQFIDMSYGYEIINKQSQQKFIQLQNIIQSKHFLEKQNEKNSQFQKKPTEQIQNNLSQTQEVDTIENFQNESKKIYFQNILKNIISAFMKHFKHMKDNKIIPEISINQFQNFRKQLVRYMKKHSFNYSVVKYLITHKIYKLLLLNFLQNESADWLNKSKVVEKEEVIQKILFLKNCIRDPKLFDQHDFS